MRKVDDGEEKEKRKEKEKEKNGVFSGHYVIASSLPHERLRPNDDRWNAARSCQLTLKNKESGMNMKLTHIIRTTDPALVFLLAQGRKVLVGGGSLNLSARLGAILFFNQTT